MSVQIVKSFSQSFANTMKFTISASKQAKIPQNHNLHIFCNETLSIDQP